MFDYHIHTTVSYDGHAEPLEMAQQAVNIGLKEICFTDHRDYQQSTPREKTAFSLEAYRNAYDGFAFPGLTVRKGVEVGLAPWNREELNHDVESYPYDFVIGSIHFIDDEDIYFPQYWQNRDYLNAEAHYFEEMLKCIQIHDHFDVLGHLTYITKCPPHPHRRPLPLSDHKDIVAEIMKELVRKGKGLEINTSGKNRCGGFLPEKEYLLLFRDLGGKIITVGSDAHNTDRIGEYIDPAIAMAKDVFGHVCTFQNREPIFHKL